MAGVVSTGIRPNRDSSLAETETNSVPYAITLFCGTAHGKKSVACPHQVIDSITCISGILDHRRNLIIRPFGGLL